MCAYEIDFDRCDCTIIHEDIINEVKEKMPEEEKLLDLADLFKVFGDSTRVKIIPESEAPETYICKRAFCFWVYFFIYNFLITNTLVNI